jgi:NAD(P)-dependent dehydrogenase (short-subunit alcohol dehydrogenase family)
MPKETSMNKQIALVTGANRGIGLEVCRQLSELGFIVYLGSRDLHKGQESHQKILSNDPNITVLELDITKKESLEKAKATIFANHGQLDALVNNAAIHYDDWEDITEIDFQILNEAMETNAFGSLQTTLTFLPLLKISSFARIVNVSSEAGALSSMNGTAPAYCLSKIALNAMTLMLAHKLKRFGILVNAVCPGWTNTDMGKGGRPIKDGAKSVVWAVNLPKNGPTGGFFRDGRELSW